MGTSHEGRLDRLVPVRVGRMAASPYGFLRGTATVMAEDSATLPSTGINPVICGDAHVGDIGSYGAAGVDHRGQAAVLRAPVPHHEGLGGPRRRRRRRPARLRGHLRAAAGRGPRPHLGGLDDRRYLGGSEEVDVALCAFARRYADQTEREHAALVGAVARGALPVERGVWTALRPMTSGFERSRGMIRDTDPEIIEHGRSARR